MKMPESVNAAKQRNRFRRLGAIWLPGGFISDFTSWNFFRALPYFLETSTFCSKIANSAPTGASLVLIGRLEMKVFTFIFALENRLSIHDPSDAGPSRVF